MRREEKRKKLANIFVTLRRQWRVSHIGNGELPNKIVGKANGLDLNRAVDARGETWYVDKDGFGFREVVLLEKSRLPEDHPDHIHIHIHEPPKAA